MDIHNEINKDIKFLAKSEIRLKILSELHNSPYSVHALVKKTKITYSSVSSNITKLEQNNYIKKIKSKYYLKPMTKIYFHTLLDFKQSVEVINKYSEFWDKHNLKQINIESMKNITNLKDSELIETTPLDIYKTHNTIKSQILDSKSLKAIFPYLHPEYPQLIEKILNDNGKVELIIPKAIYNAITSKINVKVKQKALSEKRLIIYPVEDDLNIYLTICDESMSLGLFKTDKSFDQNRILISDRDKSKKWVENLFENIKYDVIK